MEGFELNGLTGLSAIAASIIAIVPLYFKFRKDSREDRLESDRFNYEIGMKIEITEEYKNLKVENKELQKEINNKIIELSTLKAEKLILENKVLSLTEEIVELKAKSPKNSCSLNDN